MIEHVNMKMVSGITCAHHDYRHRSHHRHGCRHRHRNYRHCYGFHRHCQSYRHCCGCFHCIRWNGCRYHKNVSLTVWLSVTYFHCYRNVNPW